MIKNCCPECFGDRGLRRSIIPTQSTLVGKCDFCRTQGVQLVLPAALREYFELLVNAYRRSEDGEPLVRWFREDWGLFDHPNMNDGTAQSLLAEILDDGEIVRRSFAPVQLATSDRSVQWEELRQELMGRNRFFPQTTIDLDRLEELFTFLTPESHEVPKVWSRARIKNKETDYTLDEMGAPPKRITSHGRANPAGIPYLYLASDPETAISEVRPQTGDRVNVATSVFSPNLFLVDLRQPTRMASPFLLGDSDDISNLRNDLPWLEKLGLELTRPVLSQTAAIDYTPSQYLCEYVKKCGYDGVLYRSSIGPGINLAVFDPQRATSFEVTEYTVDHVSVQSTRLLPPL